MNNREIEESISRGIHQTTPDLLCNLTEEIGLAQDSRLANASDMALQNSAESLPGQEAEEPHATEHLAAAPGNPAEPARSRKSNRRPKWYRLALPAAAALILVIVGFLTTATPSEKTFAVVGLDVNPSIELSVNDGGKVLSAAALNDDAAEVLAELKLENVDLNTACHAIVGSMIAKGYLRPDSNSILVSIRAVDEQAGKDLERQISQNLSSYLKDSEIAVAILGQYVEEDDALEELAEREDISLGKAWLIRKLLASKESKMDEASLVKLPTQELVLLAQNRGVEAETSIGTSDTSSFISEDRAREIAFAEAGVGTQDAEGAQVEFDCEDGILVYDVEFRINGISYDYDIDARTGEVVSFEVGDIDQDEDDATKDDDNFDDGDDADDENDGTDDEDDGADDTYDAGDVDDSDDDRDMDDSYDDDSDDANDRDNDDGDDRGGDHDDDDDD